MVSQSLMVCAHQHKTTTTLTLDSQNTECHPFDSQSVLFEMVEIAKQKKRGNSVYSHGNSIIVI